LIVEFIERNLNPEDYDYFNDKLNELTEKAFIMFMSHYDDLYFKKRVKNVKYWQSLENKAIEEIEQIEICKAKFDTGKNIDPSLFLPIIEWSSLQSISCYNEEELYVKPLKGVKKGVKDDCETFITEIDCTTAVNCAWVRNKCADKSRLTKYDDVIINLEGQEFLVLQTFTYKGKLKEAVKEISNIHVRVVLSELSNNIYVLFPLGEINKQGKYFEDNGPLKSFLLDIISYCKDVIKHKCFFCGHSMGSMLALWSGRLCKQTTLESDFQDKFGVIGSGPFQWMKDDYADYRNESNIVIFCLCDIDRHNEFIYDYFLDKGSNYCYTPSILLDYGSRSNDIFPDLSMIDNCARISESFENYHHWNMYNLALRKLRTQLYQGFIENIRESMKGGKTIRWNTMKRKTTTRKPMKNETNKNQRTSKRKKKKKNYK